MSKRQFPPYIREQLRHYVYALRDPRNGQVFYIGEGEGDRVFAHANDALLSQDDPKGMKLNIIQEIHEQGLAVESFIVQHQLKSKEHALQTESALYGLLEMLNKHQDQKCREGHKLFNLTNLIKPPTYRENGLISVDEALARYGKPVARGRIPHHSMLIKPTKSWHPGMSREELYHATRGWWPCSRKRIQQVRYVFSIPNFVIRAVWEVQPDDWREQAPGDDGWHEVQARRREGGEKKSRLGFDSRREVSDTEFADVLNHSVGNFFPPGQARRFGFTYLDDIRARALQKKKRDGVWWKLP